MGTFIILILIFGFIFYFRFKYIVSGNKSLPEKVINIENINSTPVEIASEDTIEIINSAEIIDDSNPFGD